MKIIDANCGIGPWWTRNAILPYQTADILAILDYCGIDAALAHSNLAHSPAWPPDGNARAAAEAAKCPRLIPAFLLAPHPYDDGWQPGDYAKAMRRAGAKAAWLRPNYQQHGVATWIIGDLLAMCVEHRLPLFLPADALTPNDIHTLCSEFPDLRLVLTNLGYRADVWLYPLLRRHPELRVCLGPIYNPPLGPEKFVRHFGAARLIFGSGLPHFAPGSLIGMVSYSRLAEAEKAAIFAGNIERLMEEVRL